MRVLFYVGDTQRSASTRVTVVAARGLAARGHPVTLACLGESGAEADEPIPEGGGGYETIAINSGATTVGGALELRRVLAQRFIEAAVVSSERDHLIVGSAMRFAERGGVLRRIPSFERLDVHRGGKLALKLTAAGIIVSTERELAAAQVPGWTIPATVAPLGVDAVAYDEVEPAPRAAMGAPPDGVIIACSYDPSGRFRMGTVFRMLALLAPRHVNIRVVVFGPGAADDELRMHAAALGVSPVVSFLGERGWDDERRLMRAAQAGWVVSGGDNAAFACMDLMALRVPVIAERSPVTQHYVAHGITGLLLSPSDPSETASEVTAFLTGEERRVAMGNAGRTRVQRDFTETAMIDGFEQAVNAAGDRTKWGAAGGGPAK